MPRTPSKRPSPPAQAQCKFSDGKTIKTDYSSPRVKGRKIFGALVPYGQVWRTGANEATTLVTDTNVKIGDKDVPAGSYTIFTVPNADKWTLIISKKTGEWGIPYPGEGDDFGAGRYESFAVALARGEFHHRIRPDGIDLRDAHRLGFHTRRQWISAKRNNASGIGCGGLLIRLCGQCIHRMLCFCHVG